ncbi:GntR family transcriptional regulator [Neorhizobium galegae]|uniref:GntR family transcriptional regulator n=1 Tax=Neorhizobium galegae TaxID=399 RepID=UPI00278485EB|nr:GntR family transcriptional regulator [Neorhizobium galegae]MDQ0137712.1 GntR family transcriptional regulator [Neorhizobium galegae]
MTDNANKAFGAPLHRQVFLVVKNDIMAGKYAAGDPLPGEPALSKLFNVSRITVRRALADLDAAQLIDRRPGRGTFVRELPHRPPTDLGDSGLGLEMAQIGQLPARLLDFGYILPPPEVAEALDIEAGQEVQRSLRVRSQGEFPVVHLTAFVPEKLGRTFTREDLANSSLFGMLKRAGHAFASSFQKISAALAEPAIAQALMLDIGSPVLAIHRTYFDGQGMPVAFLILHASSVHYQIAMELPIGDGDAEAVKAPMTYRVKMIE